jgi:hypothetical protein
MRLVNACKHCLKHSLNKGFFDYTLPDSVVAFAFLNILPTIARNHCAGRLSKEEIAQSLFCWFCINYWLFGKSLKRNGRVVDSTCPQAGARRGNDRRFVSIPRRRESISHPAYHPTTFGTVSMPCFWFGSYESFFNLVFFALFHPLRGLEACFGRRTRHC